MRIRTKILLVGGIPIALAAAIAVAAILLLRQGDAAREGAVLASTLYRNMLVTVTARDGFLRAAAGDREAAAARYWQAATVAHANLTALEGTVADPRQRRSAATAREALDRYNLLMGEVIDLAADNDALASRLAARTAALTTLSGETRQQEAASNQTVLKRLLDTDVALSAARTAIRHARDLQSAVAAAEAARAELGRSGETPSEQATARSSLEGALQDLDRSRNALVDRLLSDGAEETAARFDTLATGYRATATAIPEGIRSDEAARLAAGLVALAADTATAQARLQEEAQASLTDLVNRTARARTSERASQEMVLSALRLSSDAERAIAARDEDAAAAILEESRRLSDAAATLPVAPDLRNRMAGAITDWQETLSATVDGLGEQNALVARMDEAAVNMNAGARALSDRLTTDAQEIGDTIRNILILGAACGVLIAGVGGLGVAGSIIRPIRQLQKDMVALAANPVAGRVAGTERPDELGEMARATDLFVTEIASREHALVRAKEEADTALVELQEAQDELVRAEKLASLGQLVAGVAHEINTPLGIAVTTSTMMAEEVRRIEHAAATRQMPLSQFERFIQRMKEGSGLMLANLNRASNLVYSFKQVAADQTSDQPRHFVVKDWLAELLTSLGPVLRKGEHTVEVDCPADLTVDTYPGALGQVLTNLLVNAVTHGFADRTGGRIAIRIEATATGTLRIVFADNGGGIPAENLGRIFDPFFTTGRNTGSTGLGLHIAHNLVTGKLRGRIEAESTPGEGTRFIVEVPSDVAVEEAAELRGAAE